MKRIINYFRRIYRLHTDFSKHEVLVWKSLKKMHFENEWYSGVYENEKKVETVFCMADDKPKNLSFGYPISSHRLNIYAIDFSSALILKVGKLQIQKMV